MKRQFQLLRYFSPLLKPYRFKLAIAFFALSLAAGSVLYTGSFIRHLVDEGFSAGNPQFLNTAFWTLIALSLILAIAAYIRTQTTATIAERVVLDLKKRLYNHCVSMDSDFFEIHSSGEMLSRINGDTVLVRTMIAASGAVGIRSLIQLIGSLIFLCLTSFNLTLYVLLLIPVLLLPISILGRRVRQHSRRTQDALELVHINAEETFQGIQTIQIFRHEEQSKQDFSDLLDKVFEVSKKRIQSRSFFIAVIIGLAFMTVSFLLWLGSLAVFKGEMSMGQLTSFIFYAIVAAGSFNSLSEVISDIQASGGGIERIYDLMMTTGTMKEPKNPKPLHDDSKACIEIQNLTFFYPSRPEKPALKNFNLKINDGEQIALVGPSGAGKSTLFKMLLRLYEPQQGQMLLHGIPLDLISINDIRTHISLVPQECTIFNTTLWNNVRMAKPDATDEEIFEACRISYISEFIEHLPERYDTVLGERGTRLSGGQRQRIAIARAVLRKPRVLLLDEATSSLDAQSENYVHQAIESVMYGRTTLIAAHRLSTVLNSDRIIVMDGGEIIAEGTHEELLKKNGLYSRLAEKQLIA